MPTSPGAPCVTPGPATPTSRSHNERVYLHNDPEAAMARRSTWIAMAMAIPATVAFTPASPPGPPPWDPQVAPPESHHHGVAAAQPAQPVVAVTPVPAAPATPPSLTPGPAGVPMPDRDVGPIVANAALTRLGAPYAWAAAGPDAFDCSGLVVWAFHQAGLTLPRSSQALAAGGQPVSLDQMQPGDVISLFPDASHVGIYVGDGRMVHAQFEGLPVIVEPLIGAPIHNVRRYR